MKRHTITLIFVLIMMTYVACGKASADPTAPPEPAATDTPAPSPSEPAATDTPAPSPSEPVATDTPAPTEAPVRVDLGYHFATMMYTADYYYQDGYVYEIFPTVEEVEITPDFDWEHYEEKVTGWYKVRYKVLDKVTAAAPDISEGAMLDCYLLEEELTGMICYLDVPADQGRFGAAETDYLYLMLLTKKEYDSLKSRDLIRVDVDESKLDPVGGFTTFTYRPAADVRSFVKSEYCVMEQYKFNPIH